MGKKSKSKSKAHKKKKNKKTKQRLRNKRNGEDRLKDQNDVKEETETTEIDNEINEEGGGEEQLKNEQESPKTIAKIDENGEEKGEDEDDALPKGKDDNAHKEEVNKEEEDKEEEDKEMETEEQQEKEQEQEQDQQNGDKNTLPKEDEDEEDEQSEDEQNEEKNEQKQVGEQEDDREDEDQVVEQEKDAEEDAQPNRNDRDSDSDSSNDQEEEPSAEQDNKQKDEKRQQEQAPKHKDNENDAPTTSEVLTKKTFASLGVCEALLEACENLKWKHATQIQAQVLPEALGSSDNNSSNNNQQQQQHRDIIGLAETGSGKTGAFCLPILQGLLRNPVRAATTALILTPTRELAFQIHTVVQGLGAGIGATSACIVGGVDRTSQAIALARHPHILICTPGRLLDHLKDTKGFHLRKVRYLVLDEADRMLSMDFEEELHQILDNVPTERQTFLFSATMTSQVAKLQRASLTDPVRIEVSTKFQTPSQLQQSYLFIPAKYKDCYLTYLINEHAGKSILVFGATCNNVQRLALLLRNLGFPAVCLHGQMNQAKRLGALRKFATQSRTILLCTDVASRGLDLPFVDLVINFDLPGHGKEYVHRVGRTARAGQAGQAVAMVTQYDVEVYQRLEVLLGKKLPAYPAADEETVLVLLERVSEAQRLATRELKEQLAMASKKHGGGRRKRRGAAEDDDDGDGEQALQRELRQRYAGGSGGSGGALPNQRGAPGKPPKKHRRRK